MKRRNAETAKLRRPVKRTKITEGMYGDSLLYLKFIMVWATIVLADYMLEFRFEFLWPFWMMLRSVYDSYKYQGLAFSMFFVCIALTSDMICFFFIPLQYIFFAASTYVWVHYAWYTLMDRGLCVPTLALCCLVVYCEGAVRGARSGLLGGGLAAHCVGYPAVTLGFGCKAAVAQRLRARRQQKVRAENEFYFQLMREALPESALLQNQLKEAERANIGVDSAHTQTEGKVQSGASPQTGAPITGEGRHMNGSVRKRLTRVDSQCNTDQTQLQFKLDKLEKHLANQSAAKEKVGSVSNGTPCNLADDEDKHDHCKGSAKSSKADRKEASTIKEEKKKNRNRDKDKESTDSHKSTEHTKEQIVKDKDVESIKSKDSSNVKEKEREREKDKEKEREREKERETREKEKEREREKEREQRECQEELRRVRAELSAAKSGEAEAKRALAEAAAADRQRRADHHHLKQAHATLQHKVSMWRSSERASLERRLGDERRARTAAEHQLRAARRAQQATPSGECENEWCRSRRSTQEAEAATLRRDLQRARDRLVQLQRDLTQATEQIRTLEARAEAPSSPGGRARARLGGAVGARRAPGALAVGRDARQAGPAVRARRGPAQDAHTGRSDLPPREGAGGAEGADGGRDAGRAGAPSAARSGSLCGPALLRRVNIPLVSLTVEPILCSGCSLSSSSLTHTDATKV